MTERRILSFWLPDWPIERLIRAHALEAEGLGSAADGAHVPFVLASAQQGGRRVTALTRAAGARGIVAGQLLTNALALCPELKIREADPAGDRQGLQKLARWAGRYSPWTAFDPIGRAAAPDGVVLDVTGCAHLFGGEETLIADCAERLAGLGITARLALADTVGAAWALARHGGGRECVTGESMRAHLRPLPVAALRLPPDMVETLRRLGLKKIGDLEKLPRGPLTARFGPEVLQRLEQAFGRAPEAISPDLPHVPFRTQLRFFDGLTADDQILEAVRHLAADLEGLLEREQAGARRLALTLFRVDGEVFEVKVGTGRPVRDAGQISRLFKEKLDGIRDEMDAGFGFELLRLSVLKSGPLALGQASLTGEGERQAGIDTLTDRLSNRLGRERVTRLAFRESHLPERAAVRVPILAEEFPAGFCEAPSVPYERLGRPLFLLPAPEPVEVIAEVPEGPPRRFVWRRVTYQVARAEGPERIEPEWWRTPRARPRDYFRVEDGDGRRFWLYREGLYGREDALPVWYIHGLAG